MTPTYAAFVLWAAFYATWLAAAVWQRKTVRGLGLHREAFSRALTAVGVILLFFHGSSRHSRGIAAWSLVGLVVLAFLFAWWARIHLGTLWSARITRKSDHRVVDTGPYALVRHPIYLGFILAFWAAPVMSLGHLVFAAATTAYILIAIQLEEHDLVGVFGEVYQRYQKHVSMIVPWPPSKA
jgi:protein-S-isoprenylcysteine O-methyltransferase Ste14